ncbi:MAG: HDIG domain-containing protein [Acidobacteria bacterium]|nr:HDIG domain-containing protein [Acidobacteriota bacterium]
MIAWAEDRPVSVDIAEARAFAREKALKEGTYAHLVSVEGVMRALARHFGEDEERWARAGLFHDLDQDLTAEDPGRHALLAAEWLRARGEEEPVVNAVLAHARPEFRTNLLSRAIVAADALAGLLRAVALMRPERAAGMKVSSVRKKLGEKSFAAGVNREEIRQCTEIGLELDRFIEIGIEGLQLVAGEIGLA